MAGDANEPLPGGVLKKALDDRDMQRAETARNGHCSISKPPTRTGPRASARACQARGRGGLAPHGLRASCLSPGCAAIGAAIGAATQVQLAAFQCTGRAQNGGSPTSVCVSMRRPAGSSIESRLPLHCPALRPFLRLGTALFVPMGGNQKPLQIGASMFGRTCQSRAETSTSSITLRIGGIGALLNTNSCINQSGSSNVEAVTPHWRVTHTSGPSSQITPGGGLRGDGTSNSTRYRFKAGILERMLLPHPTPTLGGWSGPVEKHGE